MALAPLLDREPASAAEARGILGLPVRAARAHAPPA
jgi:hypothetical protein